MSFSTTQSIALYLFQKLDFLNEYIIEYIDGEIYLNGYRIKRIYHQETFIGIKFILGINDFFNFDPDEFKSLIKNLDDFKLVFNDFYKFIDSDYFQKYFQDKSENSLNEIRRFMRNKKLVHIISIKGFQIYDHNYRCKFNSLFPYSFMINLIDPSTIEIYIKSFRMVDKYKNKIMKIHLEEKYKNNNKKSNYSPIQLVSLYLANRIINTPPVNIQIINNELFINDYLFRKTSITRNNNKKYISIFPIDLFNKYKLLDLSNILIDSEIFQLTIKLFNKFLKLTYNEITWPDNYRDNEILLRKLMKYFHNYKPKIIGDELELIDKYNFRIKSKRFPELSLYKLSFRCSEIRSYNRYTSRIELISENDEIKIKIILNSSSINTDYIRKMCRIVDSEFSIVNINDFPFEIGYTEINHFKINNYEFVYNPSFLNYIIRLNMENFHDFKSQNFDQIFKYEYVSKGYNFLMFITENILMFEDFYSLLAIGRENEGFWLETLRNYLVSIFDINAYVLRNRLIVRLDNSLKLNIEFEYHSILNIDFKISRNYSITITIILDHEVIKIYVYISSKFVKDEYNSLLQNKIKRE